MPLAVKMACKYGDRQRLPWEERISIATLALVEAARLYDPSRENANFWSVASPRIQGALLEESRRAGIVHSTKTNPDKTASYRLSKALQSLNLQDRDSLTQEEIGKITDLINEHIQSSACKTTEASVQKELYRRRARDVSLDTPVGVWKTGGRNITLLDVIPGTIPPPERSVAEEQGAEYLRNALQRAMSVLKPRQRAVLEARFLNPDGDKIILLSVAEGLGVSTARAHQIEREALKKLRAELQRQGITSSGDILDPEDVFTRPAVDLAYSP